VTERDHGLEVSIDPFGPLLTFLGRLGPTLETCFDRSPIQPMRPIDTRIDRLVDLEALARLAEWKGVVRPTRPMKAEAVPGAAVDQMKECEPQFILRNLDRVERDTDLKEPLPHTRVALKAGIHAVEPLAPSGRLFRRPELLEGTSLERVAQHQRAWRKLRDDEEWERRFCKEIREFHKGPLWAYDPDKAGSPPEAGGT
jgi:hypothetical protein